MAGVFLCSAFCLAIVLLLLHYRLLNRELEARRHAELSLRKLSVHILQIQDEERRKFASDLHDGLGQYLVGAKINLDILGTSLPDNKLLADSRIFLEDALAETRTISHLLHPPLLDDGGLAVAARWYVDGFSKRSGIASKLNIADQLERLTSVVETAIFRVLQEGLTNVHRHSRATFVEVSVAVLNNMVRLDVKDDGNGIPSEILETFLHQKMTSGTGLSGMSERIRELGGIFDLKSDRTGTTICVTLPVFQDEV
jgi:two-component system, NarL family, sensor kinase